MHRNHYCYITNSDIASYIKMLTNPWDSTAPQVRPTRNDKDIQTYFLDSSDAPGVRPYSNITTLNTKKHLPKRFQQVFFCYRNPSLCEQQYYQLRRDDSKEHCQRINRRIGYGRSIVVCHLVGISQCRGVGIAT